MQKSGICYVFVCGICISFFRPRHKLRKLGKASTTPGCFNERGESCCRKEYNFCPIFCKESAHSPFVLLEHTTCYYKHHALPAFQYSQLTHICLVSVATKIGKIYYVLACVYVCLLCTHAVHLSVLFTTKFYLFCNYSIRNLTRHKLFNSMLEY